MISLLFPSVIGDSNYKKRNKCSDDYFSSSAKSIDR